MPGFFITLFVPYFADVRPQPLTQSQISCHAKTGALRENSIIGCEADSGAVPPFSIKI